MNTWPLALQQKLNSQDFTHKFGNTLVRTDVDAGPAKVRSRFTDAVDTFSASILLDYSEYSTIYDFYKTSLNNGALPFTFEHPMSGDTITVRFVNPPTFTALGGRTFKVALDWETIA